MITARRSRGYAGEAALDTSANTSKVNRMPQPVAAFYHAYLNGDADGMLAVLSVAATVRFPSYPVLRGVDAVRIFFDYQGTLFPHLDFEIVDVLNDDNGVVAVIWRESGSLTGGAQWSAHGVDVVRHRAGVITSVEVGGPARSSLPRFSDPRLVATRSTVERKSR